MSRYLSKDTVNKIESSEKNTGSTCQQFAMKKEKYLFGISCLEVLGLGGNDMNIHNFR